MLGPLRRSLGTVVLEGGLRCSTCARPLHTHAQLHNSAVASAQADVPLPPQWAQHKKPSKPAKSSGQQQPRAKKPPAPSRAPQPTPQKPKMSGQSKVAATSQSKRKSPNTANPIKNRLHAPKVYIQRFGQARKIEESVDINSPFYFDQKEVLGLYDHPEVSVFPDEIRLKRGKQGDWRTWKWKHEPYSLLVEGLNIIFDRIPQSEHRITLPDGSPGVRVKLTGRFHKYLAIAIGDGSDKMAAIKAAALHFILKYYNSPIVRDRLVVGRATTIKGDREFKPNASAKLDVYDYAAQMNVLPRFEAVPIALLPQPSSKLGYWVRVTVEGTIIQGEGFHAIQGWAETAACVDFKQKAEEMHQGERMLVKHINTLTSQTGKKFLEYCKMKQKDWELYKFKSTSGKGHEFRGSLHLGERLLSECVMYTSKDAESICYYLAARDMRAQNQFMWDEFVTYIHAHAGEIIKPVNPLGVWMNPETIGALRNRLHRLMELERELEAFSRMQKSLSDEVDAELKIEEQQEEFRPTVPERNLQMKSQMLHRKLEAYEADQSTEAMRKIREQLPLNLHADDCLKLFENNDVCVLIGATGSGKTTQVPQLILDQYIRAGKGAECNILCTQPRRIAAMSVAKRVADERNEDLRNSVGYVVRFAHSPPKWGGSITYCTTGVLLRQLHKGWKALDGVTHVLMDEVHERDIQIDLLMVLLKRIIDARRAGNPDAPPIKIILMSATIDSTLFRKYFGNGYPNGECPTIEIPGRLFPVEKFYLDDVKTIVSQYPESSPLLDRDPIIAKYLAKEAMDRPNLQNIMKQEEEEPEESGIDWSRTGSAWEAEDASFKEDATDQPDMMIAYLIAHLCQKKENGAILVFLPGMREIMSLDKTMKSKNYLGLNFSDESQYKVFMLHSSIPAMQQEVFGPLKQGRKIILATNIAETSVTIPEVVYVIDTCKHREKRYSQLRRSTALVCTWISQSSARQRAGRAGRVRAGEYYALIYPERHELLPSGETAELKRSDLQSVCLDIRSFGIDDPIGGVLEEAIEPPTALAVQTAIKSLQSLGAFDANEKVTPLGSILSQLPVPPALGKMVLLGAIFKCLDPILILASIESTRTFFLKPPGLMDRASQIKETMALGLPSDQYAALNAFREWRFIKQEKGRQGANEFAFSNMMHVGALQMIEKTSLQMLEMLVEWDLVRDIPVSMRYNHELGDPELNVNSDVQPLVLALLATGLAPNLAVQTGPVLLQTGADPKALIHPSSVNSGGSLKQLGPQNKQPRYPGAGPPGTLVLFSTKSVSQGGVFLRDTTIIGPMTGLMFAGNVESSANQINILTVDDWLPFKFENGVCPQVRELTRSVRTYLDRTWSRLKVLKAHRRRRSVAGTSFYDADPARDPVVKSVVEILERCEHLEKLRRKLESQEYNQKRMSYDN